MAKYADLSLRVSNKMNLLSDLTKLDCTENIFIAGTQLVNNLAIQSPSAKKLKTEDNQITITAISQE